MGNSPIGEPQSAARSARSEVIFATTPGGRAARQLASALDDAYYAHLRYRLQRPVFGFHGENSDAGRLGET